MNEIEDIEYFESRIKAALPSALQDDFIKYKLMLVASVEKDSMRLASEIAEGISWTRRLPGFDTSRPLKLKLDADLDADLKVAGEH